MPSVGFHQRRTRHTPWQRFRNELDWPHPTGILLTLASAVLVVLGAATFGASPSPGNTPAALPGATPGTSQLLSPGLAPAAPARVSPTPEPAATSLVPTVKGALAGAPVQELVAGWPIGKVAPALLDINNPASLLVLANKHHPLIPANHSPADLVVPDVGTGSGEPALLRPEAAAAVERMFAAAAAQGVQMTVKSGYRSFDTQIGLYNSYVARYGQALADTASARPGYSEHQTGLALDIGDARGDPACDFTGCFAATVAAKWVAAHGADYGFLVRYENGEDKVTGYYAEPWHLRYVGVAVAQDMRSRKIPSYESYLGLPGAAAYR